MTINMKFSREKGRDTQNEETRIQIFVKQMLVTRVFVASYIGRLYVDSLKAYRDVLKIQKDEKDLISALDVVKGRIDNFYKGAIWSAITVDMEGTPSGHCLWVHLQNVPFGTYWFMIEDISFSDNGEVVIKVKLVRNYDAVATTSEPKDVSINWNEVKVSVIKSLLELLTLRNIKESASFMFALLMTIATATLYALQYLFNYSICFFREFNNLIHACTPVLLGLIDLIAKVIGGFYILVAMLWRGRADIPPHFLSIKGPPPRQIKQSGAPHQFQRRPFYK